MNYYIIKYSGPFGFIKPWTAVRDKEVFSQQFLTPSIIEGIEKKLFPELLNDIKFKKGVIYKIKRHRLSYEQISLQQEQIQPKGWNEIKDGYIRPYSILTRGVLINPTLWLAFDTEKEARRIFHQHICLCRNEDILFPVDITIATGKEFDNDADRFSGFELIFKKTKDSFIVGYNRFRENKPMYGSLKIVGHPVKAF